MERQAQMENQITESDEIAWSIKVPKGTSLKDCVAIVKSVLPDETVQVIYSVAERVWRDANRN